MTKKTQREVKTHFGIMIFFGIICVALLGAYFYFVPMHRSSVSVIINPIDANNADMIKSGSNLNGALDRLDLSQYRNSEGITYRELRLAGKLNPKVTVKSAENSSIISIAVIDPNLNFAYDYVNAIADNIQSYMLQVADKSKQGTRENIAKQISENEELLKQARADLAKAKTIESSSVIAAYKEKIVNLELEAEPLNAEIETAVKSIPAYFTTMALKTENIVNALNDYKLRLKQYIQRYEKDAGTTFDDFEEKTEDLKKYAYDITVSNELTEKLTSYLTLSAKSEVIKELIAEYKQAVENAESNTVDIQQVQLNISSYETIITSLKQKLEETKITNSSAVMIVEAAELDDSYFTTDRVVAALCALSFGFFVGFFTGLAKDLSNITITKDETIRSILGQSIDSLGWIPYERNYNSIRKRDSYASERYRILTNTLSLLLNGSGAKVLSVCSTAHNEGKTTTIVNIATNLVNMGKKVIVIDADLKHSMVENVFGVGHAQFGLTDVVTGKAIKEDAITVPVAGLPNLNLMSAGKAVDSPSIVFNSEPFTILINEFRNSYDYILIDCDNTDFVLLSRLCDVFLLNVRAGVTTVPALKNFADERRTINIPLIGYVFYGRILNGKASDSFYDVYEKAVARERYPKTKNQVQAPLAYAVQQEIIEEQSNPEVQVKPTPTKDDERPIKL